MEITRNNFLDELENIKGDIAKASFISFDAEFTALLTGECFKYRLFNTSKERYDLLKKEVSNMIMTQVGLTMFQYNTDRNSYVVVSYTFHLCPQVFGDIDQSLIFQASTLNFLCRHNFDFNKFTYEGLPYLSKAEEVKARQTIKKNTVIDDLVRNLNMEEERQLQSYYSAVTKWLSTSKEETMYLDVERELFRYIVHIELRMRFPNILTTNSLGSSKQILIYRDKNVEGANSTPIATLEDDLMTHLLGFSQIIALLEASQKPIVGHNIFLDTILLHNQFIGPLPNKYTEFKKNMNKMFPKIYDTKYISHEMGKKLSYREVWKSNALQDLFEFFKLGKCKKLQDCASSWRLEREFSVNQTYHEAGWDSFCSGYCFLYLSNWAASINRGTYCSVGPTEALRAVAPYINRVNVIRGAVPYMNFAGNDPVRFRPGLLYLKALPPRTIDVGQVAIELAACGAVDVKSYGKGAALIAASSHQTAQQIMRQLSNSKDYKIAQYSVLKHSPATKLVIWGGSLITGSLVVAYLLHKQLK